MAEHDVIEIWAEVECGNSTPLLNLMSRYSRNRARDLLGQNLCTPPFSLDGAEVQATRTGMTEFAYSLTFPANFHATAGRFAAEAVASILQLCRNVEGPVCIVRVNLAVHRNQGCPAGEFETSFNSHLGAMALNGNAENGSEESEENGVHRDTS